MHEKKGEKKKLFFTIKASDPSRGKKCPTQSKERAVTTLNIQVSFTVCLVAFKCCLKLSFYCFVFLKKKINIPVVALLKAKERLDKREDIER